MAPGPVARWHHRGDFAMTWHPIETAPKRMSILVGWWLDGDGRWWDMAMAACMNGAWLRYGGAYLGHTPTHWMSLPEPPDG